MFRSWLRAARRDWTLSQESDYNLYQSLHEPFCCICSLVTSSVASGGSDAVCGQWKLQATSRVQPTSSQVRIPESLFARTNPNDLSFDLQQEPQV